MALTTMVLKMTCSMLRNHSFLFVETDQTFAMHALVQLATCRWLAAHGQIEQWKQLYIKNLAAEFLSGEKENRSSCQALFPHAKSAAIQRPSDDESLRAWASLLQNAASYAWGQGSIAKAVQVPGTAMEARKKVLGQTGEQTLKSMEMAGFAYSLGGGGALENYKFQVLI